LLSSVIPFEANQVCTDAKESIKNDHTYVKAYYRRGTAYVALGQLDNAVKDFKQVCKMMPADKDAREKYDMTLKEMRLRQFSKCIEVEDKKIEVDVQDIVVEDSYTGPRLESIDDITPEWCAQLMEFLKGQKVLHRKY